MRRVRILDFTHDTRVSVLTLHDTLTECCQSFNRFVLALDFKIRLYFEKKLKIYPLFAK